MTNAGYSGVSRFLALAGLAAGCGGDGSGAADAAAADAETEPPGELRLSWTLVDGDEAITCEDVNALSVSLTVIPLDGFAGEVRSRPCDSGEEGVVLEIQPGPYSGRAELVSSQGVIGDPVRFDRIEVESGEEVALDPITFDVPTQGGASFRVQAQAFEDNCADDGASIEELSIELQNRDAECVPVTFEIDEGAGDVSGEYESACGGERVACVEHEQQIRFDDVEPARYRLNILARDEDGECAGLVHQFDVAGGGLIAPLGTLILNDREDCGGFDLDAGVPDAGPDLDAALDAGT